MSSTYCDRADIEARYGETNVDEWADLDNSDTSADITARINAAIAMAGDVIDDALRGSRYIVPLVDIDGNTPNSITDLAAHYAGAWLHNLRDHEDGNEKSAKTMVWVVEQCGLIRMGKRELNAM